MIFFYSFAVTSEQLKCTLPLSLHLCSFFKIIVVSSLRCQTESVNSNDFFCVICITHSVFHRLRFYINFCRFILVEALWKRLYCYFLWEYLYAWQEYAIVENIHSMRVYAGQGHTIDKMIHLMGVYAFAIFIHLNPWLLQDWACGSSSFAQI